MDCAYILMKYRSTWARSLQRSDGTARLQTFRPFEKKLYPLVQRLKHSEGDPQWSEAHATWLYWGVPKWFCVFHLCYIANLNYVTRFDLPEIPTFKFDKAMLSNTQQNVDDLSKLKSMSQIIAIQIMSSSLKFTIPHQNYGYTVSYTVKKLDGNPGTILL